jgi:succinate dehydrogenase hydrophobic anchor subunit
MPLLGSACKAAIEGFTTTPTDSSQRRGSYMELLAVLAAFLLSITILGFVGKLLWNNIVVELISVAKPAKSFWQILGLLVFASLLNP